MIPLYSTTIRRREMDAVLTCMVDEKIGPGEMNARLAQTASEMFGSAGAVPLRSPAIALRYALMALGVEKGTKVMLSALSPAWQMLTIEALEYEPLVLDVNEENALITADGVSTGMKAGGRVLLLHETCALVPDMEALTALGVPIIEDISQSAGTVVSMTEWPQNSTVGNVKTENKEAENETKKAGTFGVYTILGLEEHDAVTAGGGAVLMAAKRRDWTVLKRLTDEAATTDLLPDLNSALAFVELKEFKKNEARRREIYGLYQRAIMAGAHKTLPHDNDNDAAACFPVILAHGYKDAKQYAEKKEVEIRRAFEDSVIALRDEALSAQCMNAKALALRTALFPLYARLTAAQTEKIVKVLSTLP